MDKFQRRYNKIMEVFGGFKKYFAKILVLERDF